VAKRKADKVINQCVDHDVRLPTVRPAPKQPTSALDLHDGQVGLLAELWAKNGGGLADRVYSLFRFHPTPEDVAHLYWVVAINGDWADRLEIVRVGYDNFRARKHERGEYPVTIKHPPRRGEPGWVDFDDRRRFTFTPSTETSA
jgi:hypothetical protein